MTNIKLVPIIVLCLFCLSACGQTIETSVRVVETENLIFDKDFENNYFSVKIVNNLITDIKEKNIEGILEISHPNLQSQLSKEDAKEYLDLISVFYGNLESVYPSTNTKVGNVSNINLKAKYSKTNADLKLVFVEDENQEIKLGSISILSTKPDQLDTLNFLCQPGLAR